MMRYRSEGPDLGRKESMRGPFSARPRLRHLIRLSLTTILTTPIGMH
jgi:hypothetical protein